jgi:hypothetical protein
MPSLANAGRPGGRSAKSSSTAKCSSMSRCRVASCRIFWGVRHGRLPFAMAQGLSGFSGCAIEGVLLSALGCPTFSPCRPFHRRSLGLGLRRGALRPLGRSQGGGDGGGADLAAASTANGVLKRPATHRVRKSADGARGGHSPTWGVKLERDDSSDA